MRNSRKCSFHRNILRKAWSGIKLPSRLGSTSPTPIGLQLNLFSTCHISVLSPQLAALSVSSTVTLLPLRTAVVICHLRSRFFGAHLLLAGFSPNLTALKFIRRLQCVCSKVCKGRSNGLCAANTALTLRLPTLAGLPGKLSATIGQQTGSFPFLSVIL